LRTKNGRDGEGRRSGNESWGQSRRWRRWRRRRRRRGAEGGKARRIAGN
jgi:hypothetical protein